MKTIGIYFIENVFMICTDIYPEKTHAIDFIRVYLCGILIIYSQNNFNHQYLICMSMQKFLVKNIFFYNAQIKYIKI